MTQPPSLAGPKSLLDGIEEVVADPLRFKAKLMIGENAYASLRTINRGRELWDVLGTAGTGAAVASSSVVASTFFAPTGLLGLLGIGTAVTPIGWVAFAALTSGGACYGLYRLLGNAKGSRVIEIPKFLNTPLDTLGLGMFDLVAPVALRLAAVDGQVDPQEREFLTAHLVDEWGLNREFVTRGIRAIEPEVMHGNIEAMAKELADFLHANPDCNHRAIAGELSQFLRQMLEASGALTAQEEVTLALVMTTLSTAPAGEWSKAWLKARSHAGDTAGRLRQSASMAADWAQQNTPTGEQLRTGTALATSQALKSLRKAVNWAHDKLPAPPGSPSATQPESDVAGTPSSMPGKHG
ncbi:MAG: TerB family tellurite resistance protein [Vitreoscilla sp.]|jgi:hypothetical protein|nr:TerB family tellurite resistance protein [Vitreoscilla sp.]